MGCLIGTKQSGFSRFEDVNHTVWKTDTLWKIARALGVRVDISFETFGSLIDQKEQFSRQSLERPDFANDPAFSLGALGPAQVPIEAMFHIPIVRQENQRISFDTSGIISYINSPIDESDPSLRNMVYVGFQAPQIYRQPEADGALKNVVQMPLQGYPGSLGSALKAANR